MPKSCGKSSASLKGIMRHKTNLTISTVTFLTITTLLFTGSKLSLHNCAALCARSRKVAAAFLLSLICFAPAWAQDSSAQDRNASLFGLPSRQYLFGDWGGERTALAEKGIIFDFFYITDLEANPTGTSDKTKPVGNGFAEPLTLISIASSNGRASAFTPPGSGNPGPTSASISVPSPIPAISSAPTPHASTRSGFSG